MDDAFNAIVKQITRAEHKSQLENLDRRSLSAMTEKELAIWQTGYPADSPQFMLAEHEWQRRLTAEQVKASRFAAYMGLVGAVVGAVIGSLITWLVTQ